MYPLKPSSPAIHFLFALLLLYSFFASSYQQVCNHQDQSALRTFLTSISTSSSRPLNWSSGISCCQWEGVYCEDNGRVTRLQLPSRGLKGVISSSVRKLVALTHLNLSTNMLSGSLPDSIFELMDSLESIDLSFNRLSGNFSSSLSSKGCFPSKVHTIHISDNQFQGMIESTWFLGAKMLTTFNCSNNSFVGHIPSNICFSSPLLETLDLSHNHLSGPVPNGIGECLQLKVFRVGFNSLFGAIPSRIYSLRELTEISMPSNGLHGPLREGIGGLTNLRIMDLSSNDISSPIPDEIGELLYLEKLYLQDNGLNGPIPHSLMNCTNLIHIILRNNYLNGDFSKLDFSKLAQLQKLDLRNNSLHGTLPESIYSCKSLIAFRVFHNNLTGQISPKIVELKSLSFFSLTLNSFTNITRTLTILANCTNLTSVFLGWNFHGEFLPSNRDFLGSAGFPKLQYFSIDSCNLTGSFPEWVANLKTLRVFFLDRNRITGKLPNWIGTLPNLFSLSLTQNLFSGEIPQELCQLPALISENVSPRLSHFNFELPIFAPRLAGGYNQYTTIPAALNLSNNKLSGHIPSEIGKLQGLQKLLLGSNCFSGHIPVSISNLKNLEVLDLSVNSLTGGMPASLKGLHFLSDFNVSCNDLEGPIPTGGQFATFSESSFRGNLGLCGELLHRPCSKKARPGEAKNQHGKGGSDSFLDGFYVGSASGFAGVLAVVASCVWFNNCKRSGSLSFRSGLNWVE